mgnify:CR=1 FL=1|tara:strand:- start:5924 stop:7198 length:1275 start_codon:yes stop_codon:yes gene_type:complete
MAKQVIGIGNAANDGSGDPLRTAGDKVNDNFNEFYSKLGDGTNLYPLTFPNANATILTTSNADVGATTTSSLNADHILINDDGILKKITPANLGIGSAYTLLVQEEGSNTSTTGATTLNFVGAGVTASGAGATKTLTIPGGSGINVQDEGGALSTAGTTFNFVGSGVTASGTGATKTITIPGGASQNVFDKVAVSGQSNVVADSATDTLTLVAGTNVTITTDANADSVTINSTGTTDLNSLSAGVVNIQNDSIGFIDADDSNNSKKESIADFLVAISGSGIVISGGQLTAATGTLSNVVEDTTPQLGGDLDVNGKTIMHTFNITASGTDHYVFADTGNVWFPSSENDPTLYLRRGEQYKFNNTSGGHPIRIQSTSGASGTAYNVGVTNNAGSGAVIFKVSMSAPATLYYQCTSHANMNGTINIV